MSSFTFLLFSSFSFSSRCFYSAYFLLIVSSLALSTLSRVHLLPNKYPLPLSMTSFNSSHFLCCSMHSFGVSTTSPRKSSLFDMSPTSAIIFIKCQNRHQMKNDIRYKGNTNNTPVIIFLKIESQKLSAMVLYLGEPPRRFLLLLFFISFLISISFCCCSSFVVVLHFICFSTSSFTLPWTIAGFLNPFYTFSPAHRRVIRNTFIFNFSGIFLLRALRFWVGIFYPQEFFTLWSFTKIFDSTCVYQGLPGSR